MLTSRGFKIHASYATVFVNLFSEDIIAPLIFVQSHRAGPHYFSILLWALSSIYYTLARYLDFKNQGPFIDPSI